MATWALLGALLASAAWSPDWLAQPGRWSVRMNGALVSAAGTGLRVEVAPGRTWAIAAVPDVRLTGRVGLVRVNVRELGGGAQWLMRVHGELRRPGRAQTTGPFQSETRTGQVNVELDPRQLAPGERPVLVQLGLEGPAGAWVVFDQLELLPGDAARPAPAIPGQRNLDCVDLMPNLPQPFKLLDWRQRARDYDRFVFDRTLTGEYLPLCWVDDSCKYADVPAFGLCSYVGDGRLGGHAQESVNCLAAVLGASLCGVDKGDCVARCAAWFNHRNGEDLVLNGFGTHTGGSFWYELHPNLLFTALAERRPEFDALVRTVADRWLAAAERLGYDFNHVSYDHRRAQAVDNGKWREPDAAAGVAWLEYAAYRRYGEPRYLACAQRCLAWLQARAENPYYEVLLPFGAVTAARLNAEHGGEFDLHRLLDWCFGVSDTRGGWGVTLGNWGGYDAAGLLGSIDNRGGYAFAMNTFDQAAALAPVARYDPRYARALGKWLLNLSNAARLFYPGELPPGHATSEAWRGDPGGVIAYEGLRREWLGRSPCATGDPVALKWGPRTDLGLYGSSHVGLLGALVVPTDEPTIPAFDLLATDFYHAPADPTWLLYNPHETARTVTLKLPAGRRDLFESVSGQWLARGVEDATRLTLAADRAVVVSARPH